MTKYKLLPVFAFAILLTSCGEKEKLEPEVRSIKYMTIDKRAKIQLRKFSAVVFAVDYSYLSFEDISGRVIRVNVDIGDKVKKGEVLAVIDKERFELGVKDAEADLIKAQAHLIKANTDYDREVELLRKEASFQKRVDQYKYMQAAAVSAVKSSNAKLGLAKRDLRNTELKAPYAGFIGMRQIEPNQEVKVGQKIFRIDAKGESEVHFDVPENLLKRVKLGMKGGVLFPSHPKVKAECKVTFLGTGAGRGNAFPVKAELKMKKNSIKPGMTAEVLLKLPVMEDTSGFVIPPEAILAGKGKRQGYVFVYDPKTSKLRKTDIETSGTMGNMTIVKTGIKEGDIIATAGISFLANGMKVNLYKAVDAPSGEQGE
jgi:RND family efflux transporter MFP subunit